MPIERYPTIAAVVLLATAVFVFQHIEPELTSQYAAVPILVVDAWHELVSGVIDSQTIGRLFTLATPLFLHGDPHHLVYNMAFLWAFGALTSEYFGKWWALGVFLLTGVAGNVAHVYLNSDQHFLLIGASGAVCGFEGVYLGLALHWRLPWPNVWPLARSIPPMQLGLFAIVGFGMDWYGLMNRDCNVAFGAHIGGFITGLAIAMVITRIYPSLESFQSSRLYG